MVLIPSYYPDSIDAILGSPIATVWRGFHLVSDEKVDARFYSPTANGTIQPLPPPLDGPALAVDGAQAYLTDSGHLVTIAIE